MKVGLVVTPDRDLGPQTVLMCGYNNKHIPTKHMNTLILFPTCFRGEDITHTHKTFTLVRKRVENQIRNSFHISKLIKYMLQHDVRVSNDLIG